MSNFTGKLIECVRKHPHLYDPNNTHYRNMRKRCKTWNEIGTQLGESGAILKTKWRNIRDCYRKHLRNVNEQQSSDSTKLNRYKTWQWAKNMEFYRPVLNLPPVETIIPDIIKDEPNSTIFDNNEEIENKTKVEVENESLPSRGVETNIDTLMRAKRPREENTECHKQSFDKAVSYLKRKQYRKQKSSGDAVDLLFLGLAKSVKTFSPRRQAMTKLKIAHIVLEQEVQQRKEDEYFSRENSSSPALSLLSTDEYTHYPVSS